MPGRLADRIFSWIDASLAALGHGFIQQWTKVERSYRRPLSWLAFHLKFAFYPLLALGAIAWLAWDWSHARSLDSAEDAIFDQVVQWRPFEPKPSVGPGVMSVAQTQVATAFGIPLVITAPAGIAGTYSPTPSQMTPSTRSF